MADLSPAEILLDSLVPAQRLIKRLQDILKAPVPYVGIDLSPDTGHVAVMTQAVKLFLSPDVTIAAGSKIVVTQNGETTEYASSGVPAKYPTRQEIPLKLFDRWA